jgi:Uma2 family endonuclease
MSSLPHPRRVTPEEYLALERKAETRSEYLVGRIHALTGAGRQHNRIAANLVRELANQLRGRPCDVFVSDMRVKVDPTGLYTYPDLAVVCGEPRFEDRHLDTLLNPVVIIEILSASTEAYDRGAKFTHYRRVETLREYVLAAQDVMRVERFSRTGEVWTLSEVSGPEGVLVLDSIGCEVVLRDAYERVEFPEGDRRYPDT